MLAILVTIALRPTRHGIESQGPQILAEAVNAYQSGGERGTHEYLEELWHTQHVRAFVFDPSGARTGGTPGAARGSRTSVRALQPRGGPMRRRTWIDRLLPSSDHLRAGADARRKTVHADAGVAARVRESFSGRTTSRGWESRSPVLSSGLMCYLLAWSMTSPVTRLRKAAQSLAAGDLSARTGAPVRRSARRTDRVDARFRPHGGTHRRAGGFAVPAAEGCFARVAFSTGTPERGRWDWLSRKHDARKSKAR